jgi:TPR repeat protein
MEQPTTNFMENTIKNVVEKYGGEYIPIPSQTIPDVYELLVNHNINHTNNTDKYYLYVGWYYDNMKHNYEEAIKYYLLAIDKGNYIAMNNLAHYYNVENNYKEAIKYWLLAIDKGNYIAMNNLAHYYYNVENNYKEAIKYYLLAIDKGNYIAMNNLSKIAHKHYYLYMTELKQQFWKLNPSPKLTQFMLSHKLGNGDCHVCLSTKVLYEYDCLMHAYCLDCHLKLIQATKCCPECRFPQNPYYNDMV